MTRVRRGRRAARASVLAFAAFAVPGPAAPADAPVRALAPMPATAADAFVSTIGVDVDLVNVADADLPRLAARFAGLGVRRTRIALLEHDPHYESVVRTFFAANPNVRAYGLTNCAPPLGPYPAAAIRPADVAAFRSATGARLERIEAVNEPNDTPDKNWVEDARACIAPFATGADAPLVAPALVTRLGGADERALGVLPAPVGIGNVHRYFSGRNPDAPGWGDADACGTYGALAWSICWARANVPSGPVVVTETGWNSETEVDEATQAKYALRLFFVNAQAGIAATSLYTLRSYGGGDGFGGSGIVRPDLSPKPAYRAIANLTRVLADPGPAYRPRPLELRVEPAPVARGEGLRAMLFGKRDGTYDLALWQEVRGADPDRRGSDVSVPPVAVHIRRGGRTNVTVRTWENDGSVSVRSGGASRDIAVPVTDALTIVRL